MICMLLIDPSTAVQQFAVSGNTVYQIYNTSVFQELCHKDNERTLNIQLFNIELFGFTNFGLSNLNGWFCSPPESSLLTSQ